MSWQDQSEYEMPVMFPVTSVNALLIPTSCVQTTLVWLILPAMAVESQRDTIVKSIFHIWLLFCHLLYLLMDVSYT